MITSRFQELASTTAFKKGIPNLRIVYTPHPITDRPAELCREYIAGNNPLSNKPMLDEIYSGLVTPLSAIDAKAGFLEREARPRLFPADTAENLMEFFYNQGYTDGNPIILPTEDKVKEMLSATSHQPDEWVGQMRPSPPHEAWYYTVEMVAVNAVMAGAKPEYFPVILAIASKGATSMISSTSSFARMVVVNGPVVKEIGMNSGIGAMGPFNRANSTIGRSWTLISKNLGNSGKPGETYLGSQGNQLNFNNICFPENEEGLPKGWEPLHVQKGFEKSESVVSLFSGWSLNDIAWYSPLPQHEVIRGWLEHFFSFGVTQATLILDPIVAADVASKGYNTKTVFAKYLAEKTGTPGWLYWSENRDNLKKAQDGIEPFAGWLKRGEDAVVPVSRYMGRRMGGSGLLATTENNESITSIHIVVTGGGTNTFWSGGDLAI
jgi:hypothetical protein